MADKRTSERTSGQGTQPNQNQSGNQSTRQLEQENQSGSRNVQSDRQDRQSQR